MKPLLRQLALAGLFLLSAGAASAAVTVTYDHPENFTDLPFTPWDREQVLKDLTEHFQKLGKALPPGQDLKIDVLDVDLAGREQPSRRAGAQEIRVLHGGADWPHIHLRYSLESDGKVIKSGDEQISDMMYLQHLNRYIEGDTLQYEKQMLDDWFRKTIAPKQAASK
jgi:uncharacterized lipoprotein YbaY